MNRLRLIVTFIAGILLSQLMAAQKDVTNIFFLQSSGNGQWCGYRSESQMKGRIKELKAFIVGAAEYKNGLVSRILVTEADETGDWAVNDDYAVGNNGVIVSLKRTINVLPDSTKDEEVFIIRNNKAIRQRSTRSDLRTGKVIRGGENLFTPPPVMTKLGGFPFASLLTEKVQTVRAIGEACFAGRR